MGAFISKKKKKKARQRNITDQDKAQLDLKNARDRLKRYQKRLDKESQKLQTQALAMLKEGRKDRALLLLKIKKLKQDQVNKADAQLFSVYQLIDTIDWETQQMKVYYALREGNAALAKLLDEVPLEKVEELMADTAENIAMEEEISKAIGGSSWSQASESDLLAELAAIEEENDRSSLPEPQAAAVAPKPDRRSRPLAPAAAAAPEADAAKAEAAKADAAKADAAKADAAKADAAKADAAKADAAKADAAKADAAKAEAAKADAAKADAAKADAAKADAAKADAAKADAAKADAAKAYAAEAERLEELLPEAPSKMPSAVEDEEVVESTTPALVPA